MNAIYNHNLVKDTPLVTHA